MTTPPASDITLPERLKHETARGHVQVETRLDLMGIDSLGRYMAVLRAFHGFWPGIEARIDRALPASCRAELAPRWRAVRLSEDLCRLGMTPGEIDRLPTCRHWPAIDTPAAALGAMYVTEGSTLGAKHISRHLHARLGIDANTGAAFFAGHGDQTGGLWLRFKTLLAVQLTQPAEQDLAVAAASHTFSALNHWFEQSLHHDE